MATSTTSPTDVARGVFAAFNAHDTTAMRALWAADVMERMPDVSVSGPDNLVAYFNELFTAVPDVHMEIEAIAEDGEDVLLRWTLTGTHQGTFQGIKPTGKSVTLDGFDHMTIRDGKLAANYVVFDRQQFGQQLGLMPPDGSGAEKAMKAAFNAGTAVKRRLAQRKK